MSVPAPSIISYFNQLSIYRLQTNQAECLLSIGEATIHNVPFSCLVFANWDFGMTKPKGIETQQSEMKTTMKLLLATGSKTVTTRETWAVRFVVNVVVFATLAGFLTLVYFMTSQFVPEWQREFCNKTAGSVDSDEFKLVLLHMLRCYTFCSTSY